MIKFLKGLCNMSADNKLPTVENDQSDIERARERLKKMQLECEKNENQEPRAVQIEEKKGQIYNLVQPTVTLDDDVILSTATRVQLDEGMAKLRFHKTIYKDWNFGAVDKQGRSVILNFLGCQVQEKP